MSQLTGERRDLALTSGAWRHELLVLSYAGMEISWVTPIFLILIPQARSKPPYLTATLLGGLLLAYYAWTRVAEHYQLDVAQERLAMLLSLPVAILLGWRIFLHPDVALLDLAWIPEAGTDLLVGGSGGHWITTITVLFLWWRGVALSRRSFQFESVSLGFRAGLLLLVFGTLLLSYMVGFQVNAFIFPFFFFSLMAVALTRLEEVGQVKGDVGRLFDLYWLTVLTAAILLILLAGALLVVIGSPEGIDTMRRLWAPVGNGLIEAITWLLGIILAPFEPILLWLAGLFAQAWEVLLEGNFGEVLETMTLLGIEEEGEALATPYIEMAITVVRYVCGAGLVLLLVGAALWYLNRQRDRLQEQAEDREGLDISLGDTLARLLRNAAGRLRGAWNTVAQFGVGADLLAAISVRNIYANTTRLASRRGYPRARARTPYEYLPDLQAAFPEAQDEARTITEAYVGVHYGELPTSREELNELRAAYDRLKASPVSEKEAGG